MPKRGSNSETSYDSDNSEVNFIIEVEEATLGEEDVADQTVLDQDTDKPYEDEPIASEEWVSEYQKKQETPLKFEQKLQDRYDRKQVVKFVVSQISILCCIVLRCYIDCMRAYYLPRAGSLIGANVADVILNY